ncbi:MAG: ABC-type polysaccharide/polyol phosphate transport system ATPase subunit [Chitinophagales bacterium]|jgi:ABC-type polysaccharide/polyol phosphate transport system ATPase subunit
MDLSLSVKNISKIYGEEKVLNDVSFDLLKGEFVGVIGPNGAGKSTLLSIIAGIVKPDEGQVTIEGKLTSILEVGAGFHPELSGKENIFMVAALHGFTKKRTEQELANIIQFSEAEAYIDKPVKTYSSGMYLRLAFALFIHLDFEILLLDEVLSVGDFEFRQKAKNALSNLKNKRKTILLVTHNLSEIAQYCDRVIYLNKKIKHDSKDLNKAITAYLGDHPDKRKALDNRWTNLRYAANNSGHFESELLRIEHIEFVANEKAKKRFLYADQIDIRITYTCKVENNKLEIVLKIFDVFDHLVLGDSPCFREGYTWAAKQKGKHLLKASLPPRLLGKGSYLLNILVINDNVYQESWHAIDSFEVDFDPWMHNMVWSGIRPSIMPQLAWADKKIDDVSNK